MKKSEIIKEIENITGVKILNDKYYKLTKLINDFSKVKIVYRDRLVYSDAEIKMNIDYEKEALKICELYKITLDELKGKRRMYKLVKARVHYCRYMKKKYHNITSVSLAEYLQINHSSVMHYFYYYKGDCPIGQMAIKSESYE